MGGVPVFGEREAKKGLKKLGFIIDEGRGKGGHSLAKYPTRKPITPRQFPFITIPHRKEFGDPNFRRDFIKEVMAFSFTKEEVMQALKGKRS